MARISQLAGQINRHKNQRAGLNSPSRAHATDQHRTSSCSILASRGPVDGFQDTGNVNGRRRGGYPYRGYSGARMPVHRHRTLVLNGATQQSRTGDVDSGATSDASSSSWVTKNDRHLQLINSSVYEKEAQTRTRAIEQTRRQKQILRDERERNKLIHHLNRVANSGATGPSANQSSASTGKYEIAVQGIRFIVAKNGSKLVKVSGWFNSRSTL